jgi:hypothetical protein
MVAELGTWRGRCPSTKEWDKLRHCRCPGCAARGLRGLRASGLAGFCSRATHNLWVLLEESRWLKKHLLADSYIKNYRRRLDNSTYLPLIKKVLEMKKLEEKERSIAARSLNG